MLLHFSFSFLEKVVVNKPLKFALLCVGLLYVPTSFADDVSLLVEQAPPYTEKKREDKGLVSALVIAAFDRSGVKTTLKFANWTVVEKQVDADRQVSFMWVKSKPLMKKWLFSDPIYIQQNKFAVLKKNHPPVAQLHQLRGLKIGVTNGFAYGQPFDEFLSKLRITRSASEYQTVNKLLNEQVTMIAIDPPVATDLVKKYFKQSSVNALKFIDAPYLSETEYYLVCAKRYGNCVNLIKKFNQGLTQINNDGTRHRILSQSMQSD